jgi:Uma2 family endonuclease
MHGERFTQAEFLRMLDLGLFEGKRFELIDGELIDKMGQKPPHILCIRRLNGFLFRLFGERLLVQGSVQVAARDREWNLPEPDFAVLAEDDPAYAHRWAEGKELLLAVEVADSSLHIDRTTKRDLYARAGIPEYWVLDIAGQRMFVHRRPVEGRYVEVVELGIDERVSPAAAPDAATTVRSLMS